MKNLITTFILFVALSSCSGLETESLNENLVQQNVKISDRVTFVYNLNRSDVGMVNATLKKGGQNFQISKIQRSLDKNRLQYVYKAKDGFEGYDYVEISLRNSTAPSEVTTLKINFEISKKTF